MDLTLTNKDELGNFLKLRILSHVFHELGKGKRKRVSVVGFCADVGRGTEWAFLNGAAGIESKVRHASCTGSAIDCDVQQNSMKAGLCNIHWLTHYLRITPCGCFQGQGRLGAR